MNANHASSARSGRIARREFLTLAGACCAGTMLGGFPAPAWAGELAGKIKKAVQLHMVAGGMSVTDQFKLIQDLGFDGVEISGVSGPKPDEVLKARDATGLRVHGITNGYRTDLCAVVDEAKLYGADSVLKVPGAVTKKVAYDENYRKSQEQLRGAAAHAQSQGVRILVENVWNRFLFSPMETARFIDECQSPAVGAYFDVGNVLRYGWPEQWIRILGARIGKIHIKDYCQKKAEVADMGKGYNVPIGDGDCDWAAVRQALADIGYGGWATAEVAAGDRKYLADVAVRMNRVLGL
jgi:L-ribulose-5-phosphate 3-epimerase